MRRLERRSHARSQAPDAFPGSIQARPSVAARRRLRRHRRCRSVGVGGAAEACRVGGGDGRSADAADLSC
eukprot:1130747-Prymnesium_polylepis.1